MTGNGPRNRNFTNGDYFTELLRKHDHIETLRKDIIAVIRGQATIKGNSRHYKLSGFQGIGKYAEDYSTLLTFGVTGNLAVTYLGSYKLEWYLVSLDRSKGIAVIKYTVNNSSTIESGTRPPVLGYTSFWNNIGGKINRAFESGPMSKTKQTFQWIETLKF